MKTIMLELPDPVYTLANHKAKTTGQSLETVLQHVIAIALLSLDKFNYLTDKRGQPKGVVIPIQLWQQLFIEENVSIQESVEAIEDYCLNKTIETPLLNQEDALVYLVLDDKLPQKLIDSLEDIAFGYAIQEAEDDEFVSEQEVFDVSNHRTTSVMIH